MRSVLQYITHHTSTVREICKSLQFFCVSSENQFLSAPDMCSQNTAQFVAYKVVIYCHVLYSMEDRGNEGLLHQTKER